MSSDDPMRLDYLAAHLALVSAGLASNDGREHTVAERVRGLVEQRDAAIREADRLRHGVPVEGDFVCPDSLDLNRLQPLRHVLRSWDWKAISEDGVLPRDTPVESQIIAAFAAVEAAESKPVPSGEEEA